MMRFDELLEIIDLRLIIGIWFSEGVIYDKDYAYNLIGKYEDYAVKDIQVFQNKQVRVWLEK